LKSLSTRLPRAGNDLSYREVKLSRAKFQGDVSDTLNWMTLGLVYIVHHGGDCPGFDKSSVWIDRFDFFSSSRSLDLSLRSRGLAEPVSEEKPFHFIS